MGSGLHGYSFFLFFFVFFFGCCYLSVMSGFEIMCVCVRQAAGAVRLLIMKVLEEGVRAADKDGPEPWNVTSEGTSADGCLLPQYVP